MPTFSLARGGDYFFAARYTLVLSIVLPLLLLVLFLDHREVLGNAHALERFFVVLVVALALPCLLGQAWPSRQGSAKATTNTTKKRSSACALPSTSRWSRNSTNSSSGSTIDKTSV